MEPLTEQIKKDLIKEGASLVGFADLRNIPEIQRNGFPFGISIAVAIKECNYFQMLGLNCLRAT